MTFNLARMMRIAQFSIVVLLAVVGATLIVRAQTNDNPSSGDDDPLVDPRWPMRLDTPDGQLTIYEPQLATFDGDKLTARAAVSVLKSGQQDPTFGAIWMDSRVATDRAARTVQVIDVTVTRARFPDAANGLNEQALTTALREAIAREPMTLSLDQLLAMLEIVQKEKETAKELSNDPPKILFFNHPAVLVEYDGPPRLTQVKDSNLLRADNTPFFVALDPSTKTYYLKGAGRWQAASNPAGPFKAASQVPQTVLALADNSGYKDPQQPLTDAQAAALEIVTATEPTELIWTDGPDEMSPIADTNLLYVTNTSSDVFLQIDTQQVFVLLSGRWYSAPNRNGPWANVAPDKLPDDFHRIPPNSEKADVLAHVAGTQQAKDAIADTYVPQTAAIDRKNFEQPDVQYDGDPSFQPIENTPCSYAVNTPNSVIFVGGRYYCCNNAVWYMCGRPVGPWELCTNVPSEIYTIPPTCPIYSVRYVRVYETTPDLVYVGYLPGYVGCYRHERVVVYGTGFHYRPWIGHTYYARPWTYGLAPRYNAYSGHWGFSVGVRVGGGAVWLGAPAEQTVIVRNEGWFGHGGYRPVYVRREIEIRRGSPIIRHDEPVVRRADLNLYERRHDVRGFSHDEPRRNDDRSHEQARPAEHQPEHAAEHHLEPKHDQDNHRNDVFADPDGNVFRRTKDGWEQRDNNQWKPADHGKESAADHGKDADSHDHGKDADSHDHASPAEHANPPAPADKKLPKPPPVPEPKRDADRGGLNGDYHARVQGEERSRPQNNPAPAHLPPPPPVPAPKDNDRGASHGDSGSHSAGGDSHDNGNDKGGGDSRGKGGSNGGGGKDGRH